MNGCESVCTLKQTLPTFTHPCFSLSFMPIDPCPWAHAVQPFKMEGMGPDVVRDIETVIADKSADAARLRYCTVAESSRLLCVDRS